MFRVILYGHSNYDRKNITFANNFECKNNTLCRMANNFEFKNKTLRKKSNYLKRTEKEVVYDGELCIKCKNLHMYKAHGHIGSLVVCTPLWKKTEMFKEFNPRALRSNHTKSSTVRKQDMCAFKIIVENCIDVLKDVETIHFNSKTNNYTYIKTFDNLQDKITHIEIKNGEFYNNMVIIEYKNTKGEKCIVTEFIKDVENKKYVDLRKYNIITSQLVLYNIGKTESIFVFGIPNRETYKYKYIGYAGFSDVDYKNIQYGLYNGCPNCSAQLYKKYNSSKNLI